ncbi:TetR family transcriptional regulator [Rhodococcus sp. IEGM 1366]|uniref:TetR family transcriptional regulator n=1 Tax=Rhodococcus sp. IEGM 1366 TaxID=3082223 RepID=UPI002955CF79|nr:TetR family transcriptional regulator [Rhodococcus sp. IEGM 1366]MDV8070969.1 TetR family transcriptional regulator [Rhodococcus sp. IEGM 1366]
MRQALQLADNGGYEAVKMRDLAAGGVALGTIYRFFASRDFLVCRATSAWIHWAAVRSLPRGGSRDFRRRSAYQFERLAAQWAAHARGGGMGESRDE